MIVMEDVKAGKPESVKAGESDVVLCPLMKGPCTEAECFVWHWKPEGEDCPFGLEENSLEAIKQAALAAGKYVDEIFDIDAEDQRALFEKVIESIRDGNIDLGRLVRDALKLE